MRIEDCDRRPDRESSKELARQALEIRKLGSRIVIDDQIARSSKELARQALEMVLEMSRHHAQPHRVAGQTNPRENRVGDADMSDPQSDRRRPREPVVEEREAKRVRFNVLEWRARLTTAVEA